MSTEAERFDAEFFKLGTHYYAAARSAARSGKIGEEGLVTRDVQLADQAFASRQATLHERAALAAAAISADTNAAVMTTATPAIGRERRNGDGREMTSKTCTT